MQTAELALAAKDPAPHVVQAVDPAVDDVPAGQAIHVPVVESALVPAAQIEHADDPAVATCPAGQAEQRSEPPRENVLIGHDVQPARNTGCVPALHEHDVLAGTETLFAGHGVHALMALPAAVKVPAGHNAQLLSTGFRNCPEGHCAHTPLAERKEPAGQADRHCAADVLPVPMVSVPAGQAVQAEAPVVAENESARQGVQIPFVAALEKVPIGHAEQVVPAVLPIPAGHVVQDVALPAAEVVPAGHASQTNAAFTKRPAAHVPHVPVAVAN